MIIQETQHISIFSIFHLNIHSLIQNLSHFTGVSKKKTNEDLRWEKKKMSSFLYYKNPNIFIYIVFVKISVKVSRGQIIYFINIM